MTTKALPKGTTQEQWDRYYADMKAWNEKVIDSQPHIRDFETDEEFEKALNEWQKLKMDEPNKPGYYRANND